MSYFIHPSPHSWLVISQLVKFLTLISMLIEPVKKGGDDA
jgi:hypothetical protein